MKEISGKLQLDFFCLWVFRVNRFFGLIMMQQPEQNNGPNYSALDLELIVKRLEEVVRRIKEKR